MIYFMCTAGSGDYVRCAGNKVYSITQDGQTQPSYVQGYKLVPQ